ncbi:MAG: hypothetical protein KDK25_06495 [Leptospiraceae bacterium]|nr:hypothetical protein [Leptospiraceae bacterium]
MLALLGLSFQPSVAAPETASGQLDDSAADPTDSSNKDQPSSIEGDERSEPQSAQEELCKQYLRRASALKDATDVQREADPEQFYCSVRYRMPGKWQVRVQISEEGRADHDWKTEVGELQKDFNTPMPENSPFKLTRNIDLNDEHLMAEVRVHNPKGEGYILYYVSYYFPTESGVVQIWYNRASDEDGITPVDFVRPSVPADLVKIMEPEN